jgi:Fic family protein
MEQKLQFDFAITQKVIQFISKIDQFKGVWGNLNFEENKYLKELRKIATIQSIGSSTRIEGSTLTDAEVASLIKNLKISQLQSRDEQEVVGYYDTLETILNNHADIDLTLSNIHGLHNLLLKHSSKDGKHKGRYKEMTNQVVATYPDGTTRMIFRTTEPYLVQKEMEDLVDWTNRAIVQNEIHPLIVIGVFVYEFLSIHPYQDGNGRLSRLLTNLLLIQNGYDFVQYVSLEHIIEQHKKAYYQALMDGQKDRYNGQEKIDQWILFFLQGLSDLIQKLEAKVKAYRAIGGYLNDRQKRILEYIEKNQPVKIGDLVANLKEYKLHTIKKDLQYMVKEMEVEKLGQNKGTVYIVRKDG